jgi:hypothetical protein
MAQIARHHARVFQKFCDKSHAEKILTTDGHGWTRIKKLSRHIFIMIF